MSDIPDAGEIAKLAGLLAPGIVILGVRSRFRDTTTVSLTDRTIAFAIVSIAYGAVAYPVFNSTSGPEITPWLWQLLFSFVVPLVISIVLVFFDKSERFYKFTDWLGLKPAHHVKTAWDYTFPRTTPTYLIVHLSDGSSVAGVWEEGSFASSTAGDRDIFISHLWTVSEEGAAWTEIDPPRSMLICGGSIRMVEFIKGNRNE